MKKSTHLKKGTVTRVLRGLGSYRYAMLLSLLFATISVGITLAVPWLTGEAIDRMYGTGLVNSGGVLAVCAVIAACTLICALSQWLMTVLNNRITYGMVKRLRKSAFEKLQRLPLSYLDKHPSGETLSRMISDVDQFTDGLLLGFAQFFTGILTIVGTLALMLLVNWQIALVVILITPLSLFVASFIAKRTHATFKRQAEARAEQTALINEYIEHHKVVLAFSQEDAGDRAFGEVNRRLGDYALRATFFSSITNPSTRFVNNLVYAGVALVGATICISSPAALSVGMLSVFLNYANQYTKPFNEISGVIAELQNALTCAERVYELLDEEELPAESADTAVLDNTAGSVTLEEVCFSYTPERPLLENVSLTVRPGERIAIVGPTGCGKTTLINLLMRFYDVQKGAIRIDGKDTREITRHSLRASFGMVLQDTWIFSGSVRENICLGKPDATEAEMLDAAKAVHAHSFIKRLPNGYDTQVGEGGVALSEGQRQLLCIARVMLAKPPMLILDEATSSIDTRMELKIQRAFNKMMEGRTSFIVAHRLSTIESADRILVMRDGRIVESGDHASLLQKKGFYYTLYHSQFDTSA